MKMELTVKERHQENFAYRLESLMGRHRENPEKLNFHSLYNLKMDVISSREDEAKTKLWCVDP